MVKKSYKYYFIYKIINLINQKSYVGFHATNKEYNEDDYFGSSVILNSAIKKYGLDNFVMGIIEYINSDIWQEKERFWIKKMNTHVDQWGYNQTMGGNGTLGLKMKNSSKLKMSISRTGKICSKKTKEKLKKANTGRRISEETRNKISKSTKGIKKISEEQKKKISQSLKGKKKNMKQMICPHCGKEGKGGNMTRYHFDNCMKKDQMQSEI